MGYWLSTQSPTARSTPWAAHTLCFFPHGTETIAMPNFPPVVEVFLILILAVAELLFCALPALLWAVIGRQNLREAFAWRRPMARELVGAALLGLGLLPWVQTLIVVQNHVWPGMVHSQSASTAAMLPLMAHYPWLLVLALSLSAAFSEELFFRGPLQRALVRRMPVWVAVALGSLLFAAVHLDLQGLFARTVLGVLLAVLVLRGRSIFPAMTLHFVYDAVAVGGMAWDVQHLGAASVLRMAGQVNAGASRTELIVGPVIGTLLLGIGWRLCASAWRRKQEREAQPPAAPILPMDPGTVWPPPVSRG